MSVKSVKSVKSVSIYLKNIAGDLFPLDVAPSTSLEEIADQASVSHPESFPPGRTKVLSMEENKEHEKDEMLLVVVLDGPVIDTGAYSDDGESYERWNIALRGEMYYIYIIDYGWKPLTGERAPIYAIGVTEEVTNSLDTHSRPSSFLWDLITFYIPDVTPKEMKRVREILEPAVQAMAEDEGWDEIVQLISKNEPVECGCGSVVKYSGLKVHEKTKKHKTWSAQS